MELKLNLMVYSRSMFLGHHTTFILDTKIGITSAYEIRVVFWSWLLTFGDTEALVQEDLVHLLETASCGLGVEEVSDRYETGVENGPDDVELIAEIGNCLWGDIDNDEVGEPVRTDTEGDTLVTCAEGHDLGGVHPGDGQDTP